MRTVVGTLFILGCSAGCAISTGDEESSSSSSGGGGPSASASSSSGVAVSASSAGPSSRVPSSSAVMSSSAAVASSSQAASSSSVVAPSSSAAVLVDDAEVVSHTFPATASCSQQLTAVITVRNVGTSTWIRQDGYRLGAVDDLDPFTSNNRVELPAGASVAPGQTHDFTVTLAAPSSANTYTTDWRMVKEGIHWFGGIGAQQVNVGCAAAPPFDLAQVVIQSSPDVRGFARTSEITSLEFRPDNFHIDHTLRGQWPPVVINPADGTTQEATVWVFFAINGTWYGTGGERLRPNQADKQLTNASDIGPGWLYDPNRWGPMTNYVPQVGELVGFMVVAGSTRSDDNVAVQERTGVVLIPFPANGITAGFPPFAWVEP